MAISQTSSFHSVSIASESAFKSHRCCSLQSDQAGGPAHVPRDTGESPWRVTHRSVHQEPVLPFVHSNRRANQGGGEAGIQKNIVQTGQGDSHNTCCSQEQWRQLLSPGQRTFPLNLPNQKLHQEHRFQLASLPGTATPPVLDHMFPAGRPKPQISVVHPGSLWLGSMSALRQPDLLENFVWDLHRMR